MKSLWGYDYTVRYLLEDGAVLMLQGDGPLVVSGGVENMMQK